MSRKAQLRRKRSLPKPPVRPRGQVTTEQAVRYYDELDTYYSLMALVGPAPQGDPDYRGPIARSWSSKQHVWRKIRRRIAEFEAEQRPPHFVREWGFRGPRRVWDEEHDVD